jgi:hypothetical protein
VPGTIRLGTAFSVSVVPNWYFGRYVAFLALPHERRDVDALLGVTEPRRLFLTRSIDSPPEAFLADDRARRGEVRVVSYDGDSLLVEVSAEEPAYLSFIATGIPTAATVDGASACVERLFGTFKAVRVPSGRHEVAFSIARGCGRGPRPGAPPPRPGTAAIVPPPETGAEGPLAAAAPGLVPCNLCGADDIAVRWHRPYPARATDPASYMASTDFYDGYGRIVRCRRCGLTYTNPRLPDAEVVRAYREVVDAEYAQQDSSRSINAHFSLHTIKRFAGGGRLLDPRLRDGVLPERRPDRLRDVRVEVVGLRVRALAGSAWTSRRARSRRRACRSARSTSSR